MKSYAIPENYFSEKTLKSSEATASVVRALPTSCAECDVGL